MIQLNTQTLMAGGVALGLLINLPSMFSGVTNSANVAAENAANSAERGAATRNARQAQKGSAAALERAKAGCITVVDTETQDPFPLSEGVNVVYPDGTGRAMPPGMIICNTYGFTAETIAVYDEQTGEQMTIATNVMQVSPIDKPIFDCYRTAFMQSDIARSCEQLEAAAKQ